MSRINWLMKDIEELVNKNDFCNMKIEWDELFSSFVKLLSYRSTCGSAKNAAVLVRDNRIVSIGYNGTRSGYTNCSKENLELDSSGSCLKCIHAEQNLSRICSKKWNQNRRLHHLLHNDTLFVMC